MSDSSPRSSSRRRLVWLLVLVVLVAAGGWYWYHQHGQKNAAAASKGARSPFGMTGPTPVRVVAVEQRSFPIVRKSIGTVTALNTVNVRTRVAGELVRVAFEEGQKVKAGELLASIDPRPYEVALQQAEGTLQQNQAQLRNAELDLKRYQGLFREDSIARQTLDTQEALVNQYRGTLKNSQAAVADAKLNLAFTQIKAPIAGRVGLRQLDGGNLLSANDSTVVAVITQTQPISVVFTLPESQLGELLRRARAGQTLPVEAWDRGGSRKVADGTLQSFDNQIDTATGTLKFRARFANGDEALFPNQFVTVRVREQVLEQALVVPSASIQFGSNGTFAYVVGADNKIQVRSLKLGPDDGSLTVVTEGLAAGDRVVTEGTDRLREGNEVEVVTGASAAPSEPAKPAVRKPGKTQG
ncbi:MdtA/MuxA family multidrug efflux RND transporter periplasmic adaptor subunit [Pseudomonas oryzihabitans]|uniref:MdtA/MuxA family multidrug efflux RND transporter periplasmic adaptor subunit n=1 Tax=Pseudomonas oryzihabitans TaxID=47885 RepID=UPI0011A8D1F5|nr:MdtA/MuxA family multidrug efflux RND transporter periplasmic adaptor subunit [Pseudomonas oryzihabitans]